MRLLTKRSIKRWIVRYLCRHKSMTNAQNKTIIFSKNLYINMKQIPPLLKPLIIKQRLKQILLLLKELKNKEECSRNTVKECSGCYFIIIEEPSIGDGFTLIIMLPWLLIQVQLTLQKSSQEESALFNSLNRILTVLNIITLTLHSNNYFAFFPTVL